MNKRCTLAVNDQNASLHERVCPAETTDEELAEAWSNLPTGTEGAE
jgi:hypothetical protein